MRLFLSMAFLLSSLVLAQDGEQAGMKNRPQRNHRKLKLKVRKLLVTIIKKSYHQRLIPTHALFPQSRYPKTWEFPIR